MVKARDGWNEGGNMRWQALGVLALTGLAACAEVDFEDARPGEFEGAVSVYWLEQSTSASGSGGRFVYVPVPGFELRFIRPEGEVPRIIAPGVMYTDGGSVPRVAQAFRGFSPWSYGPVYIVHDWLFAARRCVEDPEATPEQLKTRDMSFQETVDIFVETLKTLERDRRIVGRDFSQETVASAIAGPISRNLWTRTDACDENRLSERDQAVVDRILQQQKTLRTARVPGQEQVIDGVRVRLVDTISF